MPSTTEHNGTCHSSNGEVNPVNPTSTLFNGLDSTYDKVYSQGSLQLRYLDKLASLLPEGSSVLDLGCGTGIPNAQRLAQAGMHITGIDMSSNMIDEASRNVPSGVFTRTDAMEYSPAEQGFDAIVCTLVLLMHPSTYNQAMALRMAAWLKPGGYLLFGTIDFNDFPMADGYEVEPTGRSFHHSFMGEKVIKDSTFPIGGWIEILREAGLVPVICEQSVFSPGGELEIEPEPQFFMIARRTGSEPLLGPYKHPYRHFPCPMPGQKSWQALLTRRTLHSTLSNVDETLAKVSMQREQYPQGHKDCIQLDWALDSCPDPANLLQACLSASSEVKRLSILQASPSNDVLRIVNAVRVLLGFGPQHHGALLSEAIQWAKESTFSEHRPTLSLIPAHLDFTDAESIAQSIKAMADLIVDNWLLDLIAKYDEGFIRQLVESHVQSYQDEYRQLGFEHGKTIGFDCVELVLERSMDQ